MHVLVPPEMSHLIGPCTVGGSGGDGDAPTGDSALLLGVVAVHDAFARKQVIVARVLRLLLMLWLMVVASVISIAIVATA